MLQGMPPRAMPRSLPFVPNQLVGLIGGLGALVVGAAMLKWVFRSPIGEAIAEGIRARRRRRWGGGEIPGEIAAADAQRVGALEEQVTRLQGQVAELAERLDFAERVLAERRGADVRSGREWKPPQRGHS